MSPRSVTSRAEHRAHELPRRLVAGPLRRPRALELEREQRRDHPRQGRRRIAAARPVASSPTDRVGDPQLDASRRPAPSAASPPRPTRTRRPRAPRSSGRSARRSRRAPSPPPAPRPAARRPTRSPPRAPQSPRIPPALQGFSSVRTPATEMDSSRDRPRNHEGEAGEAPRG